MKKLIYVFGTVCLVGLLLVPVFKMQKGIENPQIKFPPDTSNFIKEATLTQSENAALPTEASSPAFAKDDTAKAETDGAASALQETQAADTAFLEEETLRNTAKAMYEKESMARTHILTENRRTVRFDSSGRSASMAGSAKGGSANAAYSYRHPPALAYIAPSIDYNSMNAESYNFFEGNTFKFVKEEPLSTFSADVDTASYNIARRDIERGVKPNKDSIRTEEFINYFDYGYTSPKSNSKDPVNFIAELTDSPWNKNFQVVKIGVKAKDIDSQKIPPSNLVFLIDVSGSMSGTNRLPLIKKSFAMLVEKLRPEDKVSIVTYANYTNIVLDGVSLADEDGKQKIISAMEGLSAGGGTNGSEGLDTAYKVAKKHFIKNGNNRIILATDGDFNIGNTSLGGLEKQITEAKESGVFLSVLGFGMGNYKDDKVQTLADKGNGNYAYINNLFEAKKALIKDFGSTLFTVAKDVKFQVEFNPSKVQAYRLIGYEKRKLNNQDFNDDTKDAAELGIGQTVTVLYEIIPSGVKIPEGMPNIDELKYSVKENPKTVDSDELLTVKLRYKEPDGETSKLMSKVLKKEDYKSFAETSEDTRFALSVAAFAEILKGSKYSKNTDIQKVLETARKAKGEDAEGYRADFVKLISLYSALPK